MQKRKLNFTTSFSLLVLLSGLLALAGPPVLAQAVSGTILGTVTDANGGTLPNAKVTLIHTATGLTRALSTDESGEYIAPSLPTGVYNITVEASGFKKVSLTNVQLGVDQKARFDVKLEIGAATESVTIQGTTPLVQTDSSDLSGTINERQIVNLPLNGRDFVVLTRTLPGVQRGIPGANIDGAGSLAWRASASFSANGMRTRDNNFLLDGVDNNETWLNSVVIFPSIDALEEFKVQTSTYSAEFGRSSGGVVNIQIKSGQNAFHGSAFEFLRNDKLDANDFFNNKNSRAKPPFKQNQFGATAGGHIRRDKTFFFGDYQGGRIRDSKTYLSTVPTAKMRTGDFSELARVIYDPLTNKPFTGNVIPAAQFDPAAKAIIDQLYPLANVAGTRAASGQVINNFLYNPVLQREDDQFDGKIDNYFSAANHFFGRYSFERTHRFLPATLPHGDSGTTFGAGDGLVRAQSVALNDTHTFSPTWLNEVRVGFSRIAFKVTSIDAGTNLSKTVGIPGVNITDTATALSQIQFGPGDIRNLGANSNQPLLTFLDTYQYFDNVTHTRGAHTLKMGASLTFRRRNVFNVDNVVGNFTFQPALTSNCAGVTAACTLDSTTGFSFASFVLGYASSVTRGLMQGTVGERRPEYGAYVQDDWRVNSKLTLNLGLRYDVFVPYVEQYDRQANFDTSTGRFVVASDSATIKGIKVGRGLQTTPKKDFAPRIGFAYDVFGGGKTVVRGGYGIFWNNPLTGTSSQKPSNPPFLLSNAQTTTLLPTLKLSAGIPAPPALNPAAVPSGTTRSIFDPEFKDGYAQQWNLNIAHQLGKDYALEVSYVGSKGTHLVVKQDINQAAPVVGVRDSNVNRPFITLAPGLRALSQVQSRGYSNHNALLVKFSNRFSNGLAFVNSYTFGKTIDIVSDTEGATQNAYNFNRDRAVSDFDVKHNFTSSWSYDLPFGKGKLLGGGANALANKFIGGWQLSGILLARGGLPLNINQSQGVLSTGTGNRPNRLASGKLDNPTIDKWFDLAAFQVVPDSTGTYGNSGRNILRGPKQVNVDLSLVKNTRFKERFEHQLKFEFFNAFNHAQFANPGNTIGTAAAGTISSLLFGSTARQIQVAMKLKF
ncbi:MAG: carboxypeptidase regulatory-like domain-containing protein [Acidobacteria bacterium]|nr:carboxypeptidase regulatory-like domain-containing protein [Acidobacteriota bacterium]MBI3424060.1 carboxypeptidase regulatory-like domain-containing protein [Acidobacteriota bacterium]